LKVTGVPDREDLRSKVRVQSHVAEVMLRWEICKQMSFLASMVVMFNSDELLQLNIQRYKWMKEILQQSSHRSVAYAYLINV